MALTKPFAENGDKKAIPENTTVDGSLSYETGFGGFYALPPEEGGLYIDRAQFNQLMFDTTSAVISNQNSINTLNSKVADLESGISAGVVNLTGNQTIQGVKTFSAPPVSATNPTNNNQVANKAYVDSVGNTKANANATVNLTDNQTIAGTKTFSSPVVVPNATANTHAVNLAQLNTKANANATVNLTGNQTINGVKTFSAPPVSATNPTNNNQVANKAYVDSVTGMPDYNAGIEISKTETGTYKVPKRGLFVITVAAVAALKLYVNNILISQMTSGGGYVFIEAEILVDKNDIIKWQGATPGVLKFFPLKGAK